MQLTPHCETSDERLPTLDMQETARQILAMERELREIQRAAADAEAEAVDFRLDTEEDSRRILGDLERRAQDSLRAQDARLQAAEEQLHVRRKRRLRRALRAHENLRDQLKQQFINERTRSKAEMERVRAQLSAADERESERIREDAGQWDRVLETTREVAAEVDQTVRRFAAAHGIKLDELPDRSADDGVDDEASPNEQAEAAEQTFSDALVAVKWAGLSPGSSLTRRAQLISYYFLVLVLHGAAVALVIHLREDSSYLAAIAVVFVFVIALLLTGTQRVRGRLATVAAEWHNQVNSAITGLERRAAAAEKRLDSLQIKRAGERLDKILAAEEEVKEASAQRMVVIRDRQQKLQTRLDRLKDSIASDHNRRLDRLLIEHAAERKRLKKTQAEQRDAQQTKHRELIRTHETAYSQKTHELHARRWAALDDLAQFGQSAEKTRRWLNPAWDDSSWQKIEMPTVFPPFVAFGQLEVTPETSPDASDEATESQRITLPVALTFPSHGSLLVQHGGGDGERARALEILFNTVLRIVASFPAGKARLTIIDPVGLGQSFSALMHLADHDDALVHGRIWTETRHIEQRLTDLTEHIEKVIQKYLRNRYDTIAEYNHEAGELQEPCHFLVIADFPTAFSSRAVERLASIISSGPRCGVYTLIARDTRQELPELIDPAPLAENGLVLRAMGKGKGNGFSIDQEGLDRGVFVAEQPPLPEAASRLLDDIGTLSVDADHVELQFTVVAPDDDELWSGSTEKGVRVPIGRSGATRLQYLDLGRGTAQHALIAGRTGSGKSTLFHVMITNMALWFSPDEIELYLVDFKKGVEFKAYATHRLPHVRVVAIESDREFGLSVLRAVGAELSRRGDLFRKHGVQDLAAYRRLADAKPLPRTLLLIDEFQEYFTEDDVVARDAALLLDRFVRQGRAFGIHVVLGSQTLSGIYTLAKSSLGQMGVRIALQCNEADSLLILSEDNTAARLLSRPGDALYNDLSGQIAGNNPFQIVWLSDEMRTEQLQRLSAMTAALPARSALDSVVFEGNVPAELTKNPELAALLERPFAPGDGDDRVWLGEPNAIKGPTEVRFHASSGSNLLIVGQQREAALAMMTAAIVSLSAQHRPKDLRLIILDGGGHEVEHAAHIEQLLNAVPHQVEHFDARSAEQLLEELAAQVEVNLDNPDGAADGAPTYVFVFGLQRLRMLRQKDDFSLQFDEGSASSPGDQFLKILTEGPPQGIHTIVWSDGLTNLMRTLNRQSMREFDLRVLFQMSAADSSELMDSTAANSLGLYNAMLAVESAGTQEKFRPYAIPNADALTQLGNAISARVRRGGPQSPAGSTGGV